MPDPNAYDNEDDWMAACVPKHMDEGQAQDQAVAACLSQWREKSMVELPMLLTKAEQMKDGRIRWQARANTGEWDLEHERFDTTFWDDVLHNFSRVQEAMTKSEDVGLPVPILDIAHYSFRLPPDKRNMARAGYPIKLWQDGRALMAQGYFDDTPLGNAAAKAAQQRPVEERRVSIGVWPDWGRVELDGAGRRTYKGGRNRAYLDHLAMTAAPVDPGTVLEVKSMTQAQDALDVLGAESQPLVDELEAATTKAMPEGVVVKAEECACEPQPEQKAEGEGNAEATVKAEGKPEAKPEAEAEASFSRGDMEKFLKQFVKDFLASFKSAMDERMAPVEAGIGKIEAIEARVNALAATETEKVKAAVDSPSGDWLTEMIKKSVQRQKPVEGAEPQAAVDTSDPFNRLFGGLRKR